MTQRKPDRRIERTKTALSDALVELILERGYDRVSVNAIVERADVGRTTFYAHFEDKEALLGYTMRGIEPMIAQISQVNAAEADLLTVLCQVLEHALNSPRMLRAFLATESVRTASQRWLVQLLQTHWEHAIEQEIQFAAGGIMALLRWSQKRNAPIDEIMPTIERFLQIV